MAWRAEAPENLRRSHVRLGEPERPRGSGRSHGVINQMKDMNAGANFSEMPPVFLGLRADWECQEYFVLRSPILPAVSSPAILGSAVEGPQTVVSRLLTSNYSIVTEGHLKPVILRSTYPNFKLQK